MKGVTRFFNAFRIYFIEGKGGLIFWIFAILFKTKIQKKDIPLFILCGIFGVAKSAFFLSWSESILIL